MKEQDAQPLRNVCSLVAGLQNPSLPTPSSPSCSLLSAVPSLSVRDISHTGGDLTKIVRKIRGEGMRMKGLVSGRMKRKDPWDVGLGFERGEREVEANAMKGTKYIIPKPLQ